MLLSLLLRLSARLGWPRGAGVVVAASLGDLGTYLVTAFQLGTAFPDGRWGPGTPNLPKRFFIYSHLSGIKFLQ